MVMDLLKSMMTYISIILSIFLPIQAKTQQECINISGLWSTHASADERYYRETISQDGCDSITIAVYAAGSHLDQRLTIKMNNEWVCERGSPEKMHCLKGEWKEKNVLITQTILQEGCLYILESYLEDEQTKRTDSKASCPVHLEKFGYGSTWVRRVDKK